MQFRWGWLAHSNTFDEGNLLRDINPAGKVMRLNCLRSFEIRHKDRGSDYFLKRRFWEEFKPILLKYFKRWTDSGKSYKVGSWNSVIPFWAVTQFTLLQIPIKPNLFHSEAMSVMLTYNTRVPVTFSEWDTYLNTVLPIHTSNLHTSLYNNIIMVIQ
jgi:hypothetical protein